MSQSETTPLLHVKIGATDCNESDEEIIEISSSQKINYSEHGRKGKNGIIVFYFGSPHFGSKACPDMNGVLNRLNVRLININPRCYRHSPLSFAEKYFPKIMNHFGDDHIKNAKYFFIGYQMGCFYVLSIAHSFPSRINEICLVCPPVPLFKKSFSFFDCFCCLYCRRRDDIIKRANYLEFELQKSKENGSEDFKFIKKNKKFLDKMMNDGRMKNNIKMDEKMNMSLDFSVDSISSKIHLWYGTKDWMSPHSSWYINKLPHCIPHKVDGFGHFLLYQKFDEIVASMIHFDL